MKKYLIVSAAAAVALSAQAQLSGPNRTGPGTSPGTFQQQGSTASAVEQTSPGTSTINPARPTVGPQASPVPNTTIGTPDSTDRAFSDSLRARSSFPSSRDWERGAGAPPSGDSNSDSGRLTPPPDISPRAQPLEGSSSTTIRGTEAAASTATPGAKISSDLNTTGVNTPARVPEQPLDRALSAKIRAQLSQTPVGAKPVIRIAPETVRDLRITSQGGKVILEGSVVSQQEKDLIEVRAKEVQGVMGVENRLRIRNQSVGAPASGQTGASKETPASGQTKQNASDLKNEHRETSPDR